MTKLSEEAFLRKKLALLEQKVKIERGLPHLYLFKFYKWARLVFESDNKEIFLVAANQLSKSSTAIRKNIHIATEPSLWKKFWPNLLPVQKPNLFWYFYPTSPVATTEFETKWQQFLPQGEFKDHPQYGWKAEWDKGYIHSIIFNTGVIIQFKSYAMKIKYLQSSSVFHLTADEELPVAFLPELKSRLNATEGYFLMVFTATLGQLHWSQTMEPATKDEEKHKDALKMCVSLYDSMFYEDGTPSPWTEKKIKAAIANCPTEAEVQRRVMGRFVKAHGLRFESFNREENMSDKHPLPASWIVYSSVDPGSGGQSGHPAAIIFLAVSPDYKQGRFFKAWRGDGIPTAASDILEQYKLMKGQLVPAAEVYDWAAKDFFTVASRSGESFSPANKGRDIGIGLLNTLFKNKMLSIQRDDPELDKLVQELCSLGVDVDKTKALDDLSDAARYVASAVPWDFSGIELSPKVEEQLRLEAAPPKEKSLSEQRREFTLGIGQKSDESFDIDAEFDFWNEQTGNFEG